MLLILSLTHIKHLAIISSRKLTVKSVYKTSVSNPGQTDRNIYAGRVMVFPAAIPAKSAGFFHVWIFFATTGKTNQQTDGRTPDWYFTLSVVNAGSVINKCSLVKSADKVSPIKHDTVAEN